MPLWLALQMPPAQPSPIVWRVVATPTLSVGVRPAAYIDRRETAGGFTLQLRLALP